MIDARIDQVDLALAGLDADSAEKQALWRWAYHEMLHETLVGMHQLSHLAGIAERVVDAWHAPVDVLPPERPYMKRSALADRRLPHVLDGLGGAIDHADRAHLWKLRYASLVASTLQGMHALADKHRIALPPATDLRH